MRTNAASSHSASRAGLRVYCTHERYHRQASSVLGCSIVQSRDSVALRLFLTSRRRVAHWTALSIAKAVLCRKAASASRRYLYAAMCVEVTGSGGKRWIDRLIVESFPRRPTGSTATAILHTTFGQHTKSCSGKFAFIIDHFRNFFLLGGERGA